MYCNICFYCSEYIYEVKLKNFIFSLFVPGHYYYSFDVIFINENNFLNRGRNVKKKGPTPAVEYIKQTKDWKELIDFIS